MQPIDTKLRNASFGFLLAAIAFPALACDLPKLPAIPAKDQIGDRAPAVNAATAAYFESMKVYAACIQDELAAAGGDSAPASVKAALAMRSSTAVTEAEAIQALYQERLAVAGPTSKPEVEAALRKHIEGLATGMPDYDLLTAEVQRVTRQRLGDLQRDAAALGAIQSIEFRGVSNFGWDRFEVQGESATLTAQLHLDDAGKIDGVFLQPPLKAGTRRPTATIPRRH